jgi:Flp pilus assembly pilin Flp
MRHRVSLFGRHQRGQSIVEYALILGFVVLIAFVGLRAVGSKANSVLLSPSASQLVP